MIRSEVISGIRKAWEFSKVLDLGESYTNPAPFEPSDKFRDLALDYDALHFLNHGKFEPDKMLGVDCKDCGEAAGFSS